MASLGQRLTKRGRRGATSSSPVIFDLNKRKDELALGALLKTRKIHQVIDDYEEQEFELFQIQHPSSVYAPGFKDEFKIYLEALKRRRPVSHYGRWVYYPWLSSVVHILSDKEFQLVRTARNKNLINATEQKKFYEATVGIGGLSVGNSVALAIVLQGGGRHIRLADHDRLALSNTNRVRTGVQNLGLTKVEVTARQIYEINPYAKVELWNEGLNPKNIRRFFEGPPKLDIVIDELDNLAVKYLIREQARRARVAVVMAADNGDNAVVDIERYDLNPKTPFFHGRLERVSY